MLFMPKRATSSSAPLACRRGATTALAMEVWANFWRIALLVWTPVFWKISMWSPATRARGQVRTCIRSVWLVRGLIALSSWACTSCEATKVSGEVQLCGSGEFPHTTLTQKGIMFYCYLGEHLDALWGGASYLRAPSAEA